MTIEKFSHILFAWPDHSHSLYQPSLYQHRMMYIVKQSILWGSAENRIDYLVLRKHLAVNKSWTTPASMLNNYLNNYYKAYDI